MWNPIVLRRVVPPSRSLELLGDVVGLIVEWVVLKWIVYMPETGHELGFRRCPFRSGHGISIKVLPGNNLSDAEKCRDLSTDRIYSLKIAKSHRANIH